MDQNDLVDLVKQYPVEIFYSEEDQCFIANAPDLKYCSAHGKSREEALQEVEIAMSAWIESALEHNETLPKPSNKIITA